MDRARLMERLALAERHVREGACHVARQREIVAQLKGHSHDAASARDLLTLVARVEGPKRAGATPGATTMKRGSAGGTETASPRKYAHFVHVNQRATKLTLQQSPVPSPDRRCVVARHSR
jgi:hypothetical protein